MKLCYYRLKRLLVERETIISIVCFGFMAMAAELFNTLGWRLMSIIFWSTGIALLVGIFLLGTLLGQRKRPIGIPILFTVDPRRASAQALFEVFTQARELTDSIRAIRELSDLREQDSIIQLHRPDPRRRGGPKAWRSAWEELLGEWEDVDRRSGRGILGTEGKVYHIYAHTWLPLAMALGASVGLRRSCVLYHRQVHAGQERFFRVLDLSDPRKLLQPPPDTLPCSPRLILQVDTSASREIDPPVISSLPGPTHDFLILHVIISPTARHQLNFLAHPNYSKADNVGILYEQDLDPKKDWLPYLQAIIQIANPLADRYSHGRVDICLITPSAVAFALGMAMSRKSWIRVCDFSNNQYISVFRFHDIEVRHPFS